jgi:D-alanyl-D-alanine dipeptidase
MNTDERVERSKSKERINFSKIGCQNQSDPLVKVMPSDKIMVEPVWTLKDDFEGRMYADYIAEHPEYDGIYVRSELLKRLSKAAESLDEQYKLVIRAGHRPLGVQRRLLKDCMSDYKRDHPEVSDQEALEHARTFVSDPDTSLPPHCCGAAVDAELFDTNTGKLVDFGSPMNVDDDISFLHYEGISPEQKDNRMLLLRTMLAQGLASAAFEWWHFSYGDQVWAWFYGEQDSLYGPVDL